MIHHLQGSEFTFFELQPNELLGMDWFSNLMNNWMINNLKMDIDCQIIWNCILLRLQGGDISKRDHDWNAECRGGRLLVMEHRKNDHKNIHSCSFRLLHERQGNQRPFDEGKFFSPYLNRVRFDMLHKHVCYEMSFLII